MARRELDRSLEQPVGDGRAGRVVRVVDEHQLRPLEHVGRDRRQVRGEAEFGLEAHQIRLAAGHQRTARVDRVAGVRRQRHVAWIEEREAEVEDALLGPDRRHHLGLGVERDPEPPLVERRDRLAELGAAAVGRVLVGGGVGDGPLGGGDDRRIRRHVRIADPEADHVDARGPLGGDLALQFGEQVRRDLLQTATRSHAAP